MTWLQFFCLPGASNDDSHQGKLNWVEKSHQIDIKMEDTVFFKQGKVLPLGHFI